MIPIEDKSVGAPDLDGNLIIQGDNLKALKAHPLQGEHLQGGQSSYAGASVVGQIDVLDDSPDALQFEIVFGREGTEAWRSKVAKALGVGRAQLVQWAMLKPMRPRTSCWASSISFASLSTMGRRAGHSSVLPA